MKKQLIYICCLIGFSFSLRGENLTLQMCKELALKNNKVLLNKELDVQIAGEKKKEAFTAYFPTVSAMAMAFRANEGLVKTEMSMPGLPITLPISMLDNGTMASVTALQPIFVGGRIIATNQLAAVGKTAAEYQVVVTERDVLLQTEQYFLSLTMLQEKMKTLEQADCLLKEIHKELSLAVKSGLRLRNDLLKVEIRLQELTSKRLKLKNGLRITNDAFCQFLGVDQATFDLSKSVYQPTSPLSQQKEAESAVLFRPELQLLQQKEKATRLEKKIEIGKHLPSLAVGASYIHHNLFDKSENPALLFATLSIPISDWWKGSHAIKEQSLIAEKAKREMEDGKEKMIVQMNKVWNEVKEAYQQITVAKTISSSAKENLRLNKDCYKAGTSSMTDLLDAQLLLQKGNDKYTESCCNYQLKLAEYVLLTTYNESQVLLK